MNPKKDNLPVNTEPVVNDGGTIYYANEVIAIISGIAASEIDGVAGMVTAGGFSEIISKNRNITRGVKVEVGTEEVSVDLYTIIEYGQPIQKVASEVQENVRKSIESMTGLRVVRVDVHVQGVSFEKDKKENQSRIEAANIQHITDASQDKKNKKAEKEDSKTKAKEDAVKKSENPKPDILKTESKPDPEPEKAVENKPAAVEPESKDAVEEKPVEEKPVEEKPAEEKPAKAPAARRRKA